MCWCKWNRNKEDARIPKVMLIFPPFTQPEQSKKRCLIPLGITYIAGYLRSKGAKVKLLDCVVDGYTNDSINSGKRTFGLSLPDIRKEIESFSPDYVGVSCLMTSQEQNALTVCRITKGIDKDIHTVLGGCHPSVFPNEVLKHDEVDSVVVGEGEGAMFDIVSGKVGGIVKNSILDIEEIPLPARDLLPIEKYFDINMPENMFSPNDRVIQVSTSRGCPFRCVFCATTNIHGRWRGRTAENVISEIKQLKKEYDIDEVNFVDENLVMDRERTVKIMKGLIPLDISWSNPGGIWADGLDNELLDLMKKAGCYQLTLPVETTNKKILKEVIHKPLHIERIEPLVKHCKKIGIDTHAFFICGFPEQTRQDMMNDFEYAKMVGFESASFHIITPLPGSDIYEQYKDIVDIHNINYIHATIPHPTMSKEEIEVLVDNFNSEYNKRLKVTNPEKYHKKYVLTARKKFSGDKLDSLFRRI